MLPAPSTATPFAPSNDEIDGDHVTAMLKLTGASAVPVVVPFSVGGTAFSVDYSGLPASPITMNPGTAQIPLAARIMGDSIDEPDEIVVITLGPDPQNAQLGSPTSFTGTIIDNEIPTVSFTQAGQYNSTETGSLTVTARLSTTHSSPVTVPITIGGTATGGGVDYSIATGSNVSIAADGRSGAVTIPAGSPETALTINLVPDGLDEYNETVTLTMGTPTNAVKGTPDLHTVTIADANNPASVVSFAQSSQTSGAESGSLTVTAKSSVVSGKPINIP